MRALLIGATGYLGAHVRSAAAATGVEVITAGRQPAGGRHVVLDLARDPQALVEAVLAELAPDVVVNCAGATTGDAEALSAGNIEVPATLVAAMTAGGRDMRLVHLGSAAEYGRGTPLVPVAEDTPARPLGLYGATKLGGTRLVQLARTAGLPAVVLRVFNPVGPGAPAHSLPGRAAAEVARAIAENDRVRLGGLDAVRDFVDAGDVARAVLAAAVGPVPRQGLLNVASGRAVSARELVHGLVDIAGVTVAIDEGEAGSARSADVAWQQADVSAALAALDWQPCTPLEVSLKELWRSTV